MKIADRGAHLAEHLNGSTATASDAVGTCRRLLSAIVASWVLPLLPSAGHSATASCAGHVTTFDFHETRQGLAGRVQSISDSQQQEFQAAFCGEITNLETWARGNKWPLPDVPQLKVFVSPAYEIERSLVPLWEGRRGRMEFPAYRVMVEEATILHELVHVYFPNANRMLAEGLAVYLQQKIGKNPAYPNFGDDLNIMIRCGGHAGGPMSPPSRKSIRLAALDRISTPTELMLRFGSTIEKSGWTYIIAGSFVRYLLEEHAKDQGRDDAWRMERFRDLYTQTPLLPLRRNAGTPDRWQQVYGLSLSDLEQKWKSMVEGQTCPPP